MGEGQGDLSPPLAPTESSPTGVRGPRANRLAVAGFVAALFGWIPIAIPSVIAIALGFIALRRIRRTRERGRALAIWAIALGVAGVSWSVFVWWAHPFEPKAPSVLVTRAEFPGAWPFTVDQGVLSCRTVVEEEGLTLTFVTFTSGGTTYQLNLAMPQQQAQLEQIIAPSYRHEPQYGAVTALARKGAELCSGTNRSS